MSSILVVAAHPDDELLGVGGTIARHVVSGDSVCVLVVGEGATSRVDGTLDKAEVLKEAARNAANILGTEPPVFLNLPDNKLDTIDFLDVVQRIENHTRNLSAEVIYTHHGGDLNIDHRIVHQAVITAFRPVPGSTVRKIYSFETLSSTEWSTPSMGPNFLPTHFVDITQTLNTKISALKSYEMELRNFPHPRSVEAVRSLAKVRGCCVGLLAAEAFQVILDIDT